MHEAAIAARQALVVFLALFPIVNPVGTAPVFLSLTPGFDPSVRVRLARSISWNGFGLLIGSLLIGSHILRFFGISLPVVQVGGGLLVTASGWNLLQRPEEHREKGSEAAARRREGNWRALAFYPLTMPLTVGPGAISVALTLGANIGNGPEPWWLQIVPALAGTLLTGLSIYLCYRSAEAVARLLGEHGTSILVRLSSFILLCIGIQIFTNGATAIVKTMLVRH